MEIIKKKEETVTAAGEGLCKHLALDLFQNEAIRNSATGPGYF